MTSRINFLGAKYVVKMGVSGYPSFRLYFLANKAWNLSLFSGVLIQKIVGYARGISNKNSVSFYKIPRNYHTSLVHVSSSQMFIRMNCTVICMYMYYIGDMLPLLVLMTSNEQHGIWVYTKHITRACSYFIHFRMAMRPSVGVNYARGWLVSLYRSHSLTQEESL